MLDILLWTIIGSGCLIMVAISIRIAIEIIKGEY